MCVRAAATCREKRFSTFPIGFSMLLHLAASGTVLCTSELGPEG